MDKFVVGMICVVLSVVCFLIDANTDLEGFLLVGWIFGAIGACLLSVELAPDCWK